MRTEDETQPDASCCGPTQTSTRSSTSDPRQRSLYDTTSLRERARSKDEASVGEHDHTVESNQARLRLSARSTPGTYKNSTRAPRHERRAPRDRIQTTVTVTVLDTVLGSCPLWAVAYALHLPTAAKGITRAAPTRRAIPCRHEHANSRPDGRDRRSGVSSRRQAQLAIRLDSTQRDGLIALQKGVGLL